MEKGIVMGDSFMSNYFHRKEKHLEEEEEEEDEE